MSHRTLNNITRLPLEIRQKIWFYALPEPRVILIKQKPGFPTRINRNVAITSEPIASSHSYGGHQPSILSVNRESRAEALRFLTSLLGAYWNLEIDVPYFELPAGDNSRTEILLLKNVRNAGMLDAFKHIAIDWMIWDWEMATYTMEYRVSFGDRVRQEYQHPIGILNGLPNLKTCTFVHTDHTVEKDLTTPYVPWHLGPLTTETTLDVSIMDLEQSETKIWQQIDAKRGEIQNANLEIRLSAIHDRTRVSLPLNKRKRGREAWEMDWFG